MLKDIPFHSQINHEEDHEHPVELKDASFSWSDDHLKVGCSLVDISWHVPDGTLVAVVGAVGSGKSSLLSGKKSQLACEVDTSKVAWCSQRPLGRQLGSHFNKTNRGLVKVLSGGVR